MFKLSPEASLDGCITVENRFVMEYLPYADGDFVKVYLYGLSLAARGEGDDAIELLSRRLDLDRATVNAAVEYWSEQGLMSRLGDDITYHALRNTRPKIKKYDVDKYREFNRQSQLYIAARQITPNEYNEYYALMEKLNIEWQAMVLIVKYCVDLKGDNVSCPYILAVARNLAQDGYNTYDEVENRLEEFGVYYNDLTAVLGAMGGKRPDHEAVELYKKWIKSYKFDRDTVLAVAGTIKKGGAPLLDQRLTTYHELGLMSFDRIALYEEERRELYKLAKAINKALGVYYENVDPEISAFVRPWLDLGFEPTALVTLADYCMRNGLKTPSDLDAVVRRFFADSLLTDAAVRERIDGERRYDKDIERVMKALGLLGAVKPAYRAFYMNWADKWGLPAQVIDYAASLAPGKPFGYVNSILAAWHQAGITTVEGAKAAGVRTEQPQPSDRSAVHERISADELNSLFTKIGEDDK